MDALSRPPDPSSDQSGIGRHLVEARGLLESAAGIAVITATLYLLGVVHEQAFFGHFGIRPLYLDAPPSLYVFRGAPAVAILIIAAYWVFLLRALASVVFSVARRGLRHTLRTFFLPMPGEVQRKSQFLSFVIARGALVVLLVSPLIIASTASTILRQGLDELSLFLAFLVAVVFVWWGKFRGAVLRHVPETSKRSLERMLAVVAVLGLALVSAYRTGEQEARALVAGEAGEIVQVRLTLRAGIDDALPPGEMFAVLMTDDNYYLMRRECPTPRQPHVYEVPRLSVAAAELWSVDPTPAATPTAPFPDYLVPRAFCWDSEELQEMEERQQPGPG